MRIVSVKPIKKNTPPVKQIVASISFFAVIGVGVLITVLYASSVGAVGLVSMLEGFIV